MTDTIAPPTMAEMLHARVLDVFGGEPKGTAYRDDGPSRASQILETFGYVEIMFPTLYAAAAWAKVWADETKAEPPVVVKPRSNAFDFTNPVTVIVVTG